MTFPPGPLYDKLLIFRSYLKCFNFRDAFPDYHIKSSPSLLAVALRDHQYLK